MQILQRLGRGSTPYLGCMLPPSPKLVGLLVVPIICERRETYTRNRVYIYEHGLIDLTQSLGRPKRPKPLRRQNVELGGKRRTQQSLV